MKLQDLLPQLNSRSLLGNPAQDFQGVCYDSRKIKAGNLFVALKGSEVDGHTFIPEVLQKGASVIVCESLSPQFLKNSVTLVQVPNSAQALALIAAEYYQQPTQKVLSIGVTGTNGKTTSTYLFESILNLAGYSPAVFGTINYRHGSHLLEASHTTPQSLELQQLMSQFLKEGARSFVLEVSSHALMQHRADAIDWDAALFTNLTPEHLDFHSNMEEYFAAKSLLFEHLLPKSGKKAKRAIFNLDDAYGLRLAGRKFPFECWTFSKNKEKGASVYPLQVSLDGQGVRGEIYSPKAKLQLESVLVGEYNLSNLLGVMATCLALGLAPEVVEQGVRQFKKVPGRLEKISNSQNYSVFVDYAHTPDALRNVLRALKDLQKKQDSSKRGKLLVLFGCGGDRDSSKRPLMAKAVAELADVAFVTNDNPRTEDPQKIIAQILKGFPLDWKEGLHYQVEPDRALAIREILTLASPQDWVLIAGKGHENYQILGKEKIHFDDAEEVKKYFSDK